MAKKKDELINLGFTLGVSPAIWGGERRHGQSAPKRAAGDGDDNVSVEFVKLLDKGLATGVGQVTPYSEEEADEDDRLLARIGKLIRA